VSKDLEVGKPPPFLEVEKEDVSIAAAAVRLVNKVKRLAVI
jgi:hypothetical protein